MGSLEDGVDAFARREQQVAVGLLGKDPRAVKAVAAAWASRGESLAEDPMVTCSIGNAGTAVLDLDRGAARLPIGASSSAGPSHPDSVFAGQYNHAIGGRDAESDGYRADAGGAGGTVSVWGGFAPTG